MSELREKIQSAVDYIKKFTQSEPTIGIILGTGLGGLLTEIKEEVVLDYSNIPHFPVSTVESHHGRLIIGDIEGKKVVVMQGRFHYYEGYTMQQITFPVRVMKALGAETLIVSNAGGSVNPNYRKANIMIINDHINLLGDNPLIGVNDDLLGPRFPDMSEPYDFEYIKTVERIALENKIPVFKGVYAAMSGPNLETRAEYRFLRTIGTDVVGMSTVPEDIVARHSSMKVLGLTAITDECYPDVLEPVTLEEVIETANLVVPNLTKLITEFVKQL